MKKRAATRTTMIIAIAGLNLAGYSGPEVDPFCPAADGTAGDRMSARSKIETVVN